jgi:hypothetical protein
MTRMMKTMAALACGLLLLGGGGCRRGGAVPNPEAAALYRDAWTKRAHGDEAGYKAALAAIASRHPGTRAARRAEEMLHPYPAARGSSTAMLLLGVGAIFTVGALAAPIALDQVK